VEKMDAPAPPSVSFVKSTADKALQDNGENANLLKMDASVHFPKAGFGILLCEHCGLQVERKTHNQRFCSDVCRMAFHEFRFKKS